MRPHPPLSLGCHLTSAFPRKHVQSSSVSHTILAELWRSNISSVNNSLELSKCVVCGSRWQLWQLYLCHPLCPIPYRSSSSSSSSSPSSTPTAFSFLHANLVSEVFSGGRYPAHQVWIVGQSHSLSQSMSYTISAKLQRTKTIGASSTGSTTRTSTSL